MGSQDVRQMLAGSLGGACATVFQYPMDTIKVRLQDGGKQYRGVWGCVQAIAKDEGIVNGFFRGLPAPVIGAAVENALLFVSYRTVIDVYQDIVYHHRVESDTQPYLAVAAAAAIGGVVVAHVLTPAQLIKCKMQIQNTLPSAQRVYKNSLDCMFATYRRRGLKGLFRGHTAMVIREGVGCAFYFLAFQWVIRSLLRQNEHFCEASSLIHFLGGGCAGVAFWTSTYPIDAVKTKQQTMKADYLKLNFRQCCARLYKTQGLHGFFRGYSVTALRAFPGNAVLIAVYEQVNYVWDLIARRRQRRRVNALISETSQKMQQHQFSTNFRQRIKPSVTVEAIKKWM